MVNLKVFRTPIGFHDAYVAAPSQKAALQAWGADADLFARGIAERVTDEALIREPLRRPGEIIKVRRGTNEDYFKETPASPAPRQKPTDRGNARVDAPPQPRAVSPKKQKKQRPFPSRKAVERTEAAVADAEAVHEKSLQDLREQEAALKNQRRDLEAGHNALMRRLETARDKAKQDFRQRVDNWAAETD